MDKKKTAAFEHLQSGMFLSLTTHLPIWKGPEAKGELILPIVQSDAQNRVSIAVKMSHISDPLRLIFVILDFFLFFALLLDISKHPNRKLKNKQTKKYVVVGHVRIMYITNICITKRLNASHVIVNICTIVFFFFFLCVYQDSFSI